LTALMQTLQGAPPGLGAAEHAASALTNIANCSSDALRDRVVEAGALPALVRVLQGAEPGSGAAEAAAEALKNLAAHSDARRGCVVEAGAWPALVQALGEGTVPGSAARLQAAMALFSLSPPSWAKAALTDTHDETVAKLRAAREKFSADASLVSAIDDVLGRL